MCCMEVWCSFNVGFCMICAVFVVMQKLLFFFSSSWNFLCEIFYCFNGAALRLCTDGVVGRPVSRHLCTSGGRCERLCGSWSLIMIQCYCSGRGANKKWARVEGKDFPLLASSVYTMRSHWHHRQRPSRVLKFLKFSTWLRTSNSYRISL